MTLKIKIEMDNAAFEPKWGREAARILRWLANEVDEADIEPETRMEVTLKDVNGNEVGTAALIR